jgi:hypothetical protein
MLAPLMDGEAVAPMGRSELARSRRATVEEGARRSAERLIGETLK